MGIVGASRSTQDAAEPMATSGTQIDSGLPPPRPSRRTVLRGAALAGLAVPILAACGSDSSAGGGSTASAPSGPNTSPSEGPKKSSSPSKSPDSSGALASTSEVPKGGGLILARDGVVITQPSAGTFEGFSSTCTHLGCTLDNVSGGTINCICHGSQFSIEDGSVVTGPATAPLPKKPLTIAGNEITLK